MNEFEEWKTAKKLFDGAKANLELRRMELEKVFPKGAAGQNGLSWQKKTSIEYTGQVSNLPEALIKKSFDTQKYKAYKELFGVEVDGVVEKVEWSLQQK